MNFVRRIPWNLHIQKLCPTAFLSSTWMTMIWMQNAWIGVISICQCCKDVFFFSLSFSFFFFFFRPNLWPHIDLDLHLVWAIAFAGPANFLLLISIFCKQTPNILHIGQFKHQTLFATLTQTQHNLIMKANQICRICHTLNSHWPKKLGYVGFEFTLQLTFGA